MIELLANTTPETIGIEKVLAIVGAVVTALVSALVFLWKSIHKTMEEAKTEALERWRECEEKHDKSTEHLLEVVSKVGVLEGKVSTLVAVEDLSSQVLEAIHETRDELKEDITEIKQT